LVGWYTVTTAATKKKLTWVEGTTNLVLVAKEKKKQTTNKHGCLFVVSGVLLSCDFHDT
jgi:hypothetical protein